MSEEILASISAITPLLRAQGPDGERTRSPTAEALRLLKENRVLSLLLPKHMGGLGLSFAEYGLAHVELAKADISLCWVIHAINANLFAVSTRGDALPAAILGDGPKIISGGVLPRGLAREVEGGYVVEGAWDHCTAAHIADWIFGAVTVVDKAGEVLPGIGFVYLPKSSVTIEDSWFVVGLQGIGSDTAVAKNAYVPSACMVLPNSSRTEAHALVPIVANAGFLILLVGGVMAMRDLIVQRTRDRIQQKKIVLYHLSKVEGQIEAAMLSAFEILLRLDALVQAGAGLSAGERTRLEARMAMTLGLVHEAVDACIFVAGSSALMNANVLSRYWRDMHVALRHIAVPHVAYAEPQG